MKAGQDYNIRPVGYRALRWLRIEKFYSYWGVDFNNDHTPYEIGREMRVKYNKVSGGDPLGASGFASPGLEPRTISGLNFTEPLSMNTC